MTANLQTKGLAKTYLKQLFSGVDLQAYSPAKIGLVGDNGSGKSTLLKIIAGLEAPDLGTVSWSRNAKVGYLEQEIEGNDEVSGGEKKILKITQLFYSDYDALLLDEPDNHLDIEHKLWFENLVKEFDGIVIVISHDRKFLEEAVGKIWHLEDQKVKEYDGAYGKFRQIFEDEKRNQAHLWEVQEKERLRLKDFVRQMQVWAGRNSKRVGAYHNAQHRYERWVQDMVEKPKEDKKLNIKLNLAEQHKRKTALLIKELTKQYSDSPVLNGVNLHLFCGEKIAINAPNGSGKSTLLNIIAGKLKETGGEMRIGEGLHLGYYAQDHLDALDPECTLVEEMQKAKSFAWFDAIGYLKKFMFSDTQVEMPVKSLSGGQKSRLQLAKFLATNPDILVLDEPTNHLDLKTVIALENFLKEYEGTLVLVSHDREFVENTCQRKMELKNGKLVN